MLQFKGKIKEWEDKHKELNEQIKVYQKAQKELEDSVVLKDHNVEVRIFLNFNFFLIIMCFYKFKFEPTDNDFLAGAV